MGVFIREEVRNRIRDDFDDSEVIKRLKFVMI